MATTRELLETMPPGKALSRYVPSKEHPEMLISCRRSPSGTGYHVFAGWRVPAQHNEDPESISCGCPLQGQSHCHAEADQLDLDAAERAYAECKDKLTRRALHTITFAHAHRIGA